MGCSRPIHTPCPQQLYLQLLKKQLTNWIYGEYEVSESKYQKRINYILSRILPKRLKGFGFFRRVPMDPSLRYTGGDWPPTAHTMIGMVRLNNIQICMETIIDENIPGDVMECGVWRGGAVIFMRGVLAAYGDTTRTVWVADSFEGLPRPEGNEDRGDRHYTFNEYLGVSLEEVRSNFEKYDLLGDRVQFIDGWFEDTLPNAPIEQLSLLRIDADMYKSTMDVLEAMYPKVSSGGYVIVDDYGILPNCRRAVDTYRQTHHITEPIRKIDNDGIYWRKL